LSIFFSTRHLSIFLRRTNPALVSVMFVAVIQLAALHLIGIWPVLCATLLVLRFRYKTGRDRSDLWLRLIPVLEVVLLPIVAFGTCALVSLARPNDDSLFTSHGILWGLLVFYLGLVLMAHGCLGIRPAECNS
jgi:L-asparagine transporter-like permease